MPGVVLLPAETVSRTCPEPVTLVAFRRAESPAGADFDRVTVPLKPFTDPTVMMEVWLVPAWIVRDAGLPVRVKSEILTVSILV